MLQKGEEQYEENTKLKGTLFRVVRGAFGEMSWAAQVRGGWFSQTTAESEELVFEKVLSYVF